jgi:antitoxin (DNA-binding transcriptional repressor) of toxin-antitoxin stability system
LTDYIQQVEDGKSLLLTKDKKAIAELVPVKKSKPNGKKKRPHGLCKGEFVVTKKFFEPLPKKLLKAFGER